MGCACLRYFASVALAAALALACEDVPPPPLKISNLRATPVATQRGLYAITFLVSGPDAELDGIELKLEVDGGANKALLGLSSGTNGVVSGSLVQHVRSTSAGAEVSAQWDTLADGLAGCHDVRLLAQPPAGQGGAGDAFTFQAKTAYAPPTLKVACPGATVAGMPDECQVHVGESFAITAEAEDEDTPVSIQVTESGGLNLASAGIHGPAQVVGDRCRGKAGPCKVELTLSGTVARAGTIHLQFSATEELPAASCGLMPGAAAPRDLTLNLSSCPDLGIVGTPPVQGPDASGAYTTMIRAGACAHFHYDVQASSGQATPVCIPASSSVSNLPPSCTPNPNGVGFVLDTANSVPQGSGSVDYRLSLDEPATSCSTMRHLRMQFDNFVPRFEVSGLPASSTNGWYILDPRSMDTIVIEAHDEDDNVDLHCSMLSGSTLSASDLGWRSLDAQGRCGSGSSSTSATLRLEHPANQNLQGSAVIRCRARDSFQEVPTPDLQIQLNLPPRLEVWADGRWQADPVVRLANQVGSGGATRDLTVRALDSGIGLVNLECHYGGQGANPVTPESPPIQLTPPTLAAGIFAAGTSTVVLPAITLTFAGWATAVLTCTAIDEARATSNVTIIVEATCAEGAGMLCPAASGHACVANDLVGACGPRCDDCTGTLASTRPNYSANPMLRGFDIQCVPMTGCNYPCRPGFHGSSSCDPAPEWVQLTPPGAAGPNGPANGNAVETGGTYDPLTNTAFILAMRPACADPTCSTSHVLVYVVRYANGLDPATGAAIEPIWNAIEAPGGPRRGRDAGYRSVTDELFVGFMDQNTNTYEAYVITGVRAGTPAWHSLNLAGTPTFAGASGYTFAYSDGGDAVAFGGTTPADYVNTTLLIRGAYQAGSHNASVFQASPPPGPRPRYAQQGALTTADRLVIYGGTAFQGSGQPSIPLGDVWVADRATINPTWTQIFPAGTPPVPRHVASMVYLGGALDRIFLFSGWNIPPSLGTVPTTLSDAWILENAQGLPGPQPVWRPVNLSPSPPGRRAPVMFFDPPMRSGGSGGSNRVIVMGGRDDPSPIVDHWVLINPP